MIALDDTISQDVPLSFTEGLDLLLMCDIKAAVKVIQANVST